MWVFNWWYFAFICSVTSTVFTETADASALLPFCPLMTYRHLWCQWHTLGLRVQKSRTLAVTLATCVDFKACVGLSTPSHNWFSASRVCLILSFKHLNVFKISLIFKKAILGVIGHRFESLVSIYSRWENTGLIKKCRASMCQFFAPEFADRCSKAEKGNYWIWWKDKYSVGLMELCLFSCIQHLSCSDDDKVLLKVKYICTKLEFVFISYLIIFLFF